MSLVEESNGAFGEIRPAVMATELRRRVVLATVTPYLVHIWELIGYAIVIV